MTRKRKIHKKYLSREKAFHSHDGNDGSVNIDLIRIAAPSTQRLDEVIWKGTRGCLSSCANAEAMTGVATREAAEKID